MIRQPVGFVRQREAITSDKPALPAPRAFTFNMLLTRHANK